MQAKYRPTKNNEDVFQLFHRLALICIYTPCNNLNDYALRLIFLTIIMQGVRHVNIEAAGGWDNG